MIRFLTAMASCEAKNCVVSNRLEGRNLMLLLGNCPLKKVLSHRTKTPVECHIRSLGSALNIQYTFTFSSQL